MVAQPEVLMTDSGVFMFSFQYEDDMNKVLDEGPWIIGGVYPFVFKVWRPGVKLNPKTVEELSL